VQLKKWNFSGVVLSLVSFGIYKYQEDQFSKLSSKFGAQALLKPTKQQSSSSATSNTFQTTLTIGGGSSRTTSTANLGD
jgi:hypothetical protein